MAVYTKVSESEATEFLRAYNIGFLRELTGISQGVENSNYFLTTTEGRFILTLYEKRVNKEDLPFFLGLMEHLAKKNIPCPLPIKAKGGHALRELAGRPAAVTSFLAGAAAIHITPEECAEVGRALAALHLAGADFSLRRPNTLSMPAWDKLFGQCRPRADEVMSG